MSWNDGFYEMFRQFHNFEKREFQFKGSLGESELNAYLTMNLSGGYAKYVSDILIPAGKEKTQIDAVYITKKAIFCIEFKNLGGWIFGSENQKQWTQCFPRNEKYYFYNPVLQNRVHRNALAAVIRTVPENIVSLIVFSKRCELKKINCPNTAVIRIDDLHKYMMQYDVNHEERFTEKNVNALCALLGMYKPTPEQMNEHIDRVRKYTEGIECPKCGSVLELRKKILNNDKRVYSFGCINVECRFTRDANYAEVIKYGNDEDGEWALRHLM